MNAYTLITLTICALSALFITFVYGRAYERGQQAERIEAEVQRRLEEQRKQQRQSRYERDKWLLGQVRAKLAETGHFENYADEHCAQEGHSLRLNTGD